MRRGAVAVGAAVGVTVVTVGVTVVAVGVSAVPVGVSAVPVAPVGASTEASASVTVLAHLRESGASYVLVPAAVDGVRRHVVPVLDLVRGLRAGPVVRRVP